MRLNESGIGSLEWCLETVICAARAWGIVWQEGLAEPSPEPRQALFAGLFCYSLLLVLQARGL